MEYNHVGHVAINCSDYEKSLIFYRDILGLKQKFSLYNKDGGIWLTYMEVVPGSFVELFPKGNKEIIPYDGSGTVMHLCILVEDIEEAARELQNKGVDIYYGAPAGGNVFPVPYEKFICKAGEYCFYIGDPDGNPIEIMQYEEPTTLMTMSDDRLAEVMDKVKTDTYIVQPLDHPMSKVIKRK